MERGTLNHCKNNWVQLGLSTIPFYWWFQVQVHTGPDALEKRIFRWSLLEVGKRMDNPSGR